MNLTSFEKMLEQNDSTDIALSLIDPFPGHPFRVQEDAEMEELVESIREHGVLNPVIVLKKGKGYEMLAGHNRLNAARIAGLTEIPAIVKEGLSEEEAYVYVIETNMIQRAFSELLPSAGSPLSQSAADLPQLSARRNGFSTHSRVHSAPRFRAVGHTH